MGKEREEEEKKRESFHQPWVQRWSHQPRGPVLEGGTRGAPIRALFSPLCPSFGRALDLTRLTGHHEGFVPSEPSGKGSPGESLRPPRSRETCSISGRTG